MPQVITLWVNDYSLNKVNEIGMQRLPEPPSHPYVWEVQRALSSTLFTFIIISLFSVVYQNYLTIN